MNTFIESLASTESRQVCDTLELMLRGIWYLVEVYYIIPSHIISLVAHTVDIEKSSHLSSCLDLSHCHTLLLQLCHPVAALIVAIIPFLHLIINLFMAN